MGLRIFTEPQQGASYEQLLTVARTTEECGFEAFFRSDHYLKMGDKPAVPAYTDAWTTLAGLARDTRSVRLGTLVTSATFRPIGTFPVIVAQIDHMSGGRVEVGLGAGWYQDEYEAYGMPFASTGERYDTLEDQVAILHGLWSTEPGGTFERQGLTRRVRLEADPLRPAQRPHPPIIIGGGGGPRNARLAATFADEFNAPFVPVEAMKKAHDSVRGACEKSGRDPGQLVWSTAQVLCCGRDEAELARRAAAIGQDLDDLRRNGFAGLPGEVLDKLGTFADAGAERFYLQLLDLSDMDQLRLVAEEVLPHAPGRSA
jgi:alkanesulfonate monooxygenase SsuD/methylene tetrahydromethanopterin reductase-like flavin-dependent oxidoreductase (luciferase family)